ncbi:MAG: GldG family protein [Oscillospiraceae bacterium]|nr:GldG family protein [Oscillospiraceae bacterium]
MKFKQNKPQNSESAPQHTLLDSFRTKAFRAGGYSMAAAALVIAIAVIINLVVGSLPGKVTQKDLSSTELFTLSEDTLNTVQNLTESVTVYWLTSGSDEDTYISQLLDQYDGLSKQLSIEKIDPVVYPNFAAAYTDETVSLNSLIVVSGQRSCYVPYTDLYQYDYSNYSTTGSADVQFAGESELTRAIDYVTKTQLSKVYILTGHGETELTSTVSGGLRNLNLETSDLNLLTVSAVPEDADCILINNPVSDLSETEIALLKTYMAAGGSVMLLTSGSSSGSYPNLMSLTGSYGVTAQPGILVEGDSGHCLANYPYYLLPDVQSHEITQPTVDGKYSLLTPFAQAIDIADVPEGVSVTSLLKTTDSAFSKNAGMMANTLEKESGDSAGPFDVAVAVSQEETGTKMVWIGSAMMLSDDNNAIVSGANTDFFLNCIAWMCGQESSISIHAKNLTGDSLTLTAAAVSNLTVLLCIVLPAACLITGAVIVVRRRKH